MTLRESAARTLRSLSTTPLHYRWLNADTLNRLEKRVAEAERGHRGEIQLVIERAMPLSCAWRQRVRERAEDLFAHLRVWDTAARSGVLVYVNLAEHRLEVVADRGIAAVVEPARWQAWCDHAALGIRDHRAAEALAALIAAIGEAMRAHFGAGGDPHGNELPDRASLR